MIHHAHGKTFRRTLYQFIACCMTLGVIDLLKSVNIDGKQHKFIIHSVFGYVCKILIVGSSVV